jgi:hypothetical protein
MLSLTLCLQCRGLIQQIKQALIAKGKMLPDLDALFHQGHQLHDPEKQLQLMASILDPAKVLFIFPLVITCCRCPLVIRCCTATTYCVIFINGIDQIAILFQSEIIMNLLLLVFGSLNKLVHTH